MKRAIGLALVTAVSVLQSQQQEPPADPSPDLSSEQLETIAVLGLGCNGISEEECAGLSNRLRSELFDTKAFSVFERSRMDQILKEQGFQRAGCTDDACAIEIGQLLNVGSVALGSVDKVGKTYSVNVRLVDVATGRIKHSVVEDCQGCTIDAVLVKGMRTIARRLGGLETKQDEPVASVTTDEEPPEQKDLEKTEAGCKLRITADSTMPVYVDGKPAGSTPITDLPVRQGEHRISGYDIEELAQFKDRLKKLENDPNLRDDTLAVAIKERIRLGSIVVSAKPGECPPRIHFDIRKSKTGKRPVFVARRVPE